MSKTFNHKISKYINELVQRGVIIEGDDTSEDYKIYDVVCGYTMICDDIEIYRITCMHDEHLKFVTENDEDVLIIDDASDLPLLSNIQITVDLPLVEDDIEEVPVDNDRLEVIEKRLDELTQLIRSTSERLDALSDVHPLIAHNEKNTSLPFVIADKSTETKANWVAAINYCESLGEGWRLPSLAELSRIYELGDNDFESCPYWTATTANVYNSWFINMDTGFQCNLFQSGQLRVRAICDVDIVKLPFVIVAKAFEVKTDWYGAVKFCETLGDGWRLPTLDELNVIYESENDFNKDWYWSSTTGNSHTGDSSGAWSQDLNSGYQSPSLKTHNGHFVRAVRDIK
jgi:hypothetical protein